MTSQDDATVNALRQALVSRDVEEAARLLPSVRVAVAHRDGAVSVVVEGGSRVLPVFLSFASWEAFQSADEITALSSTDFATVLEQVEVDAVLFDPALDSAVRLPANDVRVLLTGAYVSDGDVRLAEAPTLAPFPRLASAVRPLVGDVDQNVLRQIWAGERVVGDRRVPALVVKATLTQRELEPLLVALQAAPQALPHDLEVIPADSVGRDDPSAWAAVCIGDGA